MMKFKNLISYLILCLITLIIFCTNAKGNGVMVGPPLAMLIPLIMLMFIITFTVEYIIIYLFTKNLIDKRSKLSKSVFAVNFFTFPTTQMLAVTFLSLQTFNLMNYFLIELIPIVLECLFYLKIYRDLQIPVRNNIILLSTVSANLVTAAIGLGLIIPQMILFF